MRYLFDTNAIMGVLAGHKGLIHRLRAHDPDDFGMPAIVAHELYFGAFKGSKGAENLALIQRLRLPVVAFDHDDARHAGQIRAALAL